MTPQEDQRIKVELHCHTQASADCIVPFEKYLQRCKRLGIDKIAVTDHNLIDGALAAKQMAPDRVIVGEEILTTQGELLGYFMTEWVPPRLTPMETIHRLREQGAVISIPHPFDPMRGKGWGPGDLEAIAPYVDAIETFNARCLEDTPNKEAAVFAREQGLLETVGSDAHTVNELGRATLIMPCFSDAESFKAGLKHAEKTTQLSPLFIHFFSSFARAAKKLKDAFKS